jgi:hypothetical protein
MIHKNKPTAFERRWLERIDAFERHWLERLEQRSERQSEWKRLRGIQRHRQLYRLGMIALGFCVALLAGMVVFIVLLFLLHPVFVL